MIGWSESGAQAGYFVQGAAFTSPAFEVDRVGAFDNTTSPILYLIDSRTATDYTVMLANPIIKIGGCLAVSGDELDSPGGRIPR